MRNIWQKMTTYIYTCLFLRDFALIMYFLSEMLNQGSIMNKKIVETQSKDVGLYWGSGVGPVLMHLCPTVGSIPYQYSRK